MKAIEFISLNLKAGDKVSLTYRKTAGGTPMCVTCFFDGYETILGQISNSPEWILPVFRECSKNGKMLSRRLPSFPYFSDIVSVERVPQAGEVVQEVIDGAGSESMFNAVRNIIRRAEAQARELLREMDILFPGKKVYLVSGYRPSVAAGTILAIHSNKGRILVDAYNDIETMEGLDEEQAAVTDWPMLLHCLHHSIKNAPDVFETEDPEDVPDFFLCDGEGGVIRHEDIPDATHEDMPVLYDSFITDMLKARLWLDTVGEDDLRELFPTDYMSWEKNPGGLDFATWMHASWQKMPRNVRYRRYTEATRPQEQ